MINLQKVNFDFEALVRGVVRDFLNWLKKEGFEFKEELQVVFTSYFALLELREAVNKLIKEYEKLPVFEGQAPEKAYQAWLKSRTEKKVISFRKKGVTKNDSRGSL